MQKGQNLNTVFSEICTKQNIDLETKNSKWLVLVNPHAGGKKAERVWPHIRKTLENRKFDMHCVFTEYRGHAIKIIKEAIVEEGFTKIIAVGGDGTFNEVINGIFNQLRYFSTEIRLGIITVGTGNDWGRMYDFPDSYEEQISIIANGKSFLQDVGKVYYKFDASATYRYFVNIAGMGYDALVAKKSNMMKEKGHSGTMAYLLNLVAGLFQYNNVFLEIEADGKKVFSGKVFSMNIGICKFNGGGMMQLPDAISDDGLFDLTVIGKITKFKVVKNIKNLYDGSFVEMKEVSRYRGRTFTIGSIPHSTLFLETDGESLGHSPLVFEILPRAIKLFVP